MNCQKSKDNLPEGYFENIYNSVTSNSFFTPLSRSLIEEGFNIYNMTEVRLRLCQTTQHDADISETEFVNSADLTNKQLFHYSNTLKVPSTLIPLAQKHLLSIITHRFIRVLLSPFYMKQAVINQQVCGAQIADLIRLNKAVGNIDMMDRLIQLLYKFQGQQQRQQSSEGSSSLIEEVLWENFESLKRSLVLIPKVAMQRGTFKELDRVRAALGSIEKLTRQKFEEKRRQASQTDQDSVTLGSGSASSTANTATGGHQVPNKTPSFFDLVYNYFTDTKEEEDEREKQRQREATELKAIQDMANKFLINHDNHQEEELKKSEEVPS